MKMESTSTPLRMNGKAIAERPGTSRDDLRLRQKMHHQYHRRVGSCLTSKFKSLHDVALCNRRILWWISIFYEYSPNMYLFMPSSNCACYDFALAYSVSNVFFLSYSSSLPSITLLCSLYSSSLISKLPAGKNSNMQLR